MTTTKDENNRVREWVIGLPSAADLTPLSHSLISRALSRAFCIPPSSTPAPCSEDVLRASQSTLQLLQQKSSPLALGSFDPYSSYESVGVYGVEGGGDEDRNVYESLKRNRGNLGRNGVRLDKSPIFNKGGWAYDKGQGRDGGDTSPRNGGEGVGNIYSGTGIGQSYYWSGVSPGPSGSLGADVSRRGGLEEGVEFTNDANLEKFRKLADTESEDVDSADGLDGNPARTLKRPRLVWTPQLHKRFVDAVGHLGIKNAVPKTIMQLMNVEGLTRENVASHLQKYRLYLKRMQGLSSEGPSSSDPLFASAPLPPNLTSSPHFFGSHHLSRIESGVSCPPFGPSGVPSPHTPGMLVPGAMVNGSMHHFGRFDHHPYNIGLSRSASRPVLNFGDHRDRPLNSLSNQQGSGSPPRHVLSLFPPSGP